MNSEKSPHGKYGVPSKLPDGSTNPEYMLLWRRDHGAKPRGEALKGKPFSDERRANLSLAWDARRARGISEETRQRMSESGRGRKLSDDHRRKISETKQKKRAERYKEPHYCRKCPAQLIIGVNWLESQARANNSICDSCRKEDIKERSLNRRKTLEGKQHDMDYRQTHKDEMAQYSKAHLEQLWDEAFSHYGRKCIGCGETRRKFLTLDHRDNDGAEDKIKYGYIGLNLYKKLDWPNHLQILCWNCQASKAIKLAREQSLILHPTPSDIKYWSSGPKMGYCQVCSILLTDATTSPKVLSRRYGMCHNCRKAYDREQRDYYKKRVIDHFGGKCYCCGETRIDRLTQGHINNDGALHRRNGGDTGGEEYRHLVKSGFKTDYPRRVECFNCNCGAHMNGGSCPHKTDQKT